MLYQSTRGGITPSTFLDTLLEGLTPDGGLFVPQTYPTFSAQQLEALRPLSYTQLAQEILHLFMDDIPAADLQRMIGCAYGGGHFSDPHIAPLRPLRDGVFLLGLSCGPTLAFKDMAMQLLGELFAYALERRNSHLNILAATSGDTGSSAEYALRGRSRIAVFMLSPWRRMSEFQQAQMYSLQDDNIHNLAIEGVFDQCQDIVKGLSEDGAFKSRYHIGAVNSINWARIAAQVVYYFHGYFAATRGSHEKVSFAIPSGNFGNALAGHIARQMGLPIERLIVSTNENDVLDEFFTTGLYAPRQTTLPTSCPSMDISKASNLERFIFDLIGRDGLRLRSLWQQLAAGQPLDLRSEQPRMVAQFGFVSGASTHQQRLTVIRDCHRLGVLVDPHTAAGIHVGLAWQHKQRSTIPLICLETAQPVKFAATLTEAVGFAPPYPPHLADLEKRPQRYKVLPAQINEVRNYITAHAE